MRDVSVFVLAGGRSSRMGSDKALLTIGAVNLLQLTLDKARSLTSNVTIVGNRERYASYGEVIEDLIPGCGPLSGIHTVLSATSSGLNLVLSVDMPLMDSKFLQWLTGLAATDQAMVTVPRSGGRLQPLCAVYRRAILPKIEAALAEGQYKVDTLFMKVTTRILTEEECMSAGFHAEIFRNINTPEEYDALLQTSAAESTPEGQRR